MQKQIFIRGFVNVMHITHLSHTSDSPPCLEHICEIHPTHMVFIISLRDD